MPYPNEHACRLRDPGDFDEDSFARSEEEHESGKMISLILGKLKGAAKTTLQAMRFNKDEWSEEEARSVCESADGSFEPASEATKGATLEARIVCKSALSGIVKGPALIPGEPDADGEELTKEKIEEVAHYFVEKSRFIDVEHTLEAGGALVSSDLLRFPETHIVDGKTETYPEGTWMLGVRVAEDKRPEVENGSIRGFSIMGVPRKSYESALAANKSALPLGMRYQDGELRKTKLSDLGEDWTVVAVSLLRSPAVKRSRFVVVKSAKPWLDRLKDRFNISTKADDSNDETVEEKMEVNTMTKDELKKLLGELDEDEKKEIASLLAPPVVEEPTEPEPPPVEDDAVSELKAEIEAVKGELAKKDEIIAKFKDFADAATKSKRLSLDSSPSGDDGREKINRDVFGRRIR